VRDLFAEQLNSPPQCREVLVPRTQQSHQHFTKKSYRCEKENNSSDSDPQPLKIKPPLRTSLSSQNMLRDSYPAIHNTGAEEQR